MVKMKQAFIEGMEPPTIPEIEDAAEALAETRSKRMALTKLEVEQAEELLALMHDNGLTTYEFDGKTVEISSLEKVKAKRQKEEE